MRRILFLLFLLSLLFSISAFAATGNQHVQGWCEVGGQYTVTQGLNSSTKDQGSYPLCTVTVYISGTTTPASIYSDNLSSPTPLANPFTATNLGFWSFYVGIGEYDIVLSGTVNPSFTLSDVFIGQTSGFPIGAVTATYPIVATTASGTANISCPTCQSPVPGWLGSLTATQGSADITASINDSTGVIPPQGYFLVDSEWEYFTGSTNLGGGNFTLTGLSRGVFNTFATGHSLGADILSAVYTMVDPTSPLFAWVTAGSPQAFLIDCPIGGTFNGQISFSVGCPGDTTSNGFMVYTNGGFQANAAANYINVGASLYVGWSPGAGEDLNWSEPLQNGWRILRNNLPNAVTSQISYENGIAGVVSSVTPSTAPAPIVFPAFIPSGSTTNTYICTGVDDLGNNIPGTPVSIPNLAASGWPTNAYVGYECVVPGSVFTSMWRTSGGPNTGLLTTASGPAILAGSDGYTTASGGSPSGTNTTVPHTCVNGLQFCELSAASGTPPVACSGSTQGWLFHNTAATVSPFAQVCNGTSWVTAY